MQTEFKCLTYLDYYVDFNLFEKGIYFTSTPLLYEKSTTISDLIERGREFKDMLGNNALSETFFENLKKCELKGFKLTPNS